MQGNSPLPRAAHACATVGNRGYVFGGRYKVKKVQQRCVAVQPLCCEFLSYDLDTLPFQKVQWHTWASSVVCSNADMLWSTELQTKWPILHWPGHMGVAWNVRFFFFLMLFIIFCRFSVVSKNDYFLALFHCVYLFPCSCGRSVPQKGPVGRSWHSFTPVSPDHIFLFGGFTTDRETLSESDSLFRCRLKKILSSSKWSLVSRRLDLFFRWCLAVLC